MDKCNCPGPCNAKECLIREIGKLRTEVADARRTGEYWKAEHQAANLQIQELQKGYAGFTAEEWFGKHGQLNSERLDLMDKLKESERIREKAIAKNHELAESVSELDFKLQETNRLNRDLWWLLENEPSGPGEGMVSTPEDVKLQREWAEKYEMVRAGLPINTAIEKRNGEGCCHHPGPDPVFCWCTCHPTKGLQKAKD